MAELTCVSYSWLKEQTAVRTSKKIYDGVIPGNAVMSVNGEFMVGVYVDPITGEWSEPRSAALSLALWSKKGEVALFRRNAQNQYYMVFNKETAASKEPDLEWVFWRAGTTKPEVIAKLGENFYALLEGNVEPHLVERAHDYNIFGIGPGQKYTKVNATPIRMTGGVACVI